jgi:hypothetical protein
MGKLFNISLAAFAGTGYVVTMMKMDLVNVG